VGVVPQAAFADVQGLAHLGALAGQLLGVEAHQVTQLVRHGECHVQVTRPVGRQREAPARGVGRGVRLSVDLAVNEILRGARHVGAEDHQLADVGDQGTGAVEVTIAQSWASQSRTAPAPSAGTSEAP